MGDLVEFLGRPLGEQPLGIRVALGAVVVAAVIVVAGLATTGGDGSTTPPSSVLTEPQREKRSDRRSLIEQEELGRAKASTQTFARSYLAALYGRAQPGSIECATPARRRRVERELIRVPPTRAELRPHIVALELFSRDAATAIAEAVVDDGDAPRYPLRVLLTARGERWAVSMLLND